MSYIISDSNGFNHSNSHIPQLISKFFRSPLNHLSFFFLLQNLEFQTKQVRMSNKADMVEIKDAAKCDSEMAALLETDGAMPAIKTRRVGDFVVVDKAGVPEPIEALQFFQKDLFLSGVVYPAQGPTTKETGRRVELIGPLRSFSLDCSGKEVAVSLHTDAATYITVRPAASYKKVFSNLSGQADITFEVVQALMPQLGGNVQASLEEIIARLARTKTVKGFNTPREGLLLNGKFLLAQLTKMDIGSSAGSKGAVSNLGDTAFAKALADALKDFKYVGAQGANAGIVISRDPRAKKTDEATEGDAQMQADIEFARQLQAKMDVEARGRGRAGPPKGQSAEYIKVSEAEIADDYPAPTPYNKEEEETDELLLYDEELAEYDPECLPRRLLTDFSIYNSDGLMATLELLPMLAGVDTDVELYASGVVVDDDGDFSGAQTLVADADGAGGSSSAAAAAGGSSGAGSAGTEPAPKASDAGMRMYLSQIREWVVEFGAEMLFITIRTDVAWYRLSVPAQKYKPWFDVVLKCSRIAARVLGMISEESRASKVSFADVVKRLSKEEPDKSLTFISKRPDAVERYLAVHAQILLSCFSNFPVKAVRNSAFATTLKDKLAAVRHSKLYRTAIKSKTNRAVNRNPMKDRAAGGRSKPMTATATTMVKSVWQAYFIVSEKLQAEEGAEGAEAAAVAQEVEEDLNEEENDEEIVEDALAKPSPAKKGKGKTKKAATKPKAPKVAWVGAPTSTTGGHKFYSSFTLGDQTITLGDAIALAAIADSDDESTEETVAADEPLGLVQCMWQDASGGKHIQLRVLVRGVDTVLGDAASDSELFLTTEVETFLLSTVVGKVNVHRMARAWDSSRRVDYFKEDAALRARNEEAARAGTPLELFWRRQYVPEKGMFCDPPKNLTFGTRLAEEEDEVEAGVHALADNSGFVKDGVTYKIGDFMFVGPEVFEQMPEASHDVQLPEYLANSRFHKGSHVGLRAWGIGRLVKLGAAASKKTTRDANDKLSTVTLQRFWRPEDISEDAAYRATSFYEVYAGDEELTVDIDDVVGPVKVLPRGNSTDISTFSCVGTFTKKKKAFGPAPKDLATTASGSTDVEMMDATGTAHSGNDGIALATMDIFAGVGGLSEGMHQAGAAYTQWAIEYESPAADAFKLNNPDAAVFCNNCNVLLHAAMVKSGQDSDCLASVEAIEASKNLPAEDMAALPRPGEVDFICGGPPCQGYSGMNRFNKGNWSMVQNSMVMSFLSYADFYRPRYFLLENVRNFVSHNKSFTFRLTVRSLLDMGYQVRFGVLNAGNFGVAQSRKRTFIWAAAPGELLPDWPQLMHAFRTPQLTINLPGNVQYTAVPQTDGAPLRPITVRDAIGDLPAIGNGHDLDSMDYAGPAISAFQRHVRGDCSRLTEHISKQMNELNLERCRCIPKNCPGADWRVLEEIVAADPSRAEFKGQPLVPWCLPNTADRHNGWRGLFGRLDWSGHFPTSTTDPQPMGKVGQVFHPEQDRIVSVRECARAQGFPDHHRFSGNVHNKHRQVGNAVPPPLAAALGRQLRKALEKHAEEQAEELMMAQM
jgi:DNA (cytosine-5)-methyltransferase 1